MGRRVIDGCHEAILTRLDHFCGIYGALSAGRRVSASGVRKTRIANSE